MCFTKLLWAAWPNFANKWPSIVIFCCLSLRFYHLPTWPSPGENYSWFTTCFSNVLIKCYYAFCSKILFLLVCRFIHGFFVNYNFAIFLSNSYRCNLFMMSIIDFQISSGSNLMSSVRLTFIKKASGKPTYLTPMPNPKGVVAMFFCRLKSSVIRLTCYF